MLNAKPATFGFASRSIRLVSMVEEPDPSPRSFTVDDERLAEARPRLSAEEFAIDDVTDEEWDAFHAVIASA